MRRKERANERKERDRHAWKWPGTRERRRRGRRERCSESWLQVNLILDGSSSPLKYLVNRFRSSTYPRSLQTFDSLCFARGRLSAPRFHPSVLVPFVLPATPPQPLATYPSPAYPKLVRDKTKGYSMPSG